MSWSARDMKPDLNPNDLAKTGVQGRERVITDFILPAMRNIAPFFPSKQPSETVLRAYAEKALAQNFPVESILETVKILPDKFERFPSWIEFVTHLRHMAPVKNMTESIPVNPWFEALTKATNELISEHGLEKIEQLADRYSIGVYEKPLESWGEWKMNIVKLFINDRMKMGTQSSMDQIINYARAKLKETEGRNSQTEQRKPASPSSFVSRTATYDNF